MTKIYEAKNHLLIRTGYENPAEHCHMAAHMIISMKGSVKVQAGNETWQCHGVLIPSGVSHVIDTDGNPVLVFLYDSTTSVAMEIQNVRILDKEDCEKITALYAVFEKHETTENYQIFEEGVLKQLGINIRSECVTDERILQAMQYIRSAASQRISCQNAADMVYLSQGRFSHLFREQAGMTFASYVIYQRIMYVYAMVLQGKSITEAALEAGFSSSAHFADTNRRVFGLPASDITDDLIFIKVT